MGGIDKSTGKVDNELAVFDPTSKHWIYPYPAMPTPRWDPAVSTYDIWLLVAGGCTCTVLDDIVDLATVELLNTSTNQWLSASPLPTPCSLLTSAIIQENWYLGTHSKQVFCVSLPDIVSQAVDESTTSKSPALWCHLPDTPLSYSSVIALRGSLLTVGGGWVGFTASTDIYLYQPEIEEWTEVGELPSPRHYCTCVLLPTSELLVVWGQEHYEQPLIQTTRVNVAYVLN